MTSSSPWQSPEDRMTGAASFPSGSGETLASPGAVVSASSWLGWSGRAFAVAALLLLVWTGATRLEGLGRKPYHHDESIHALHSYNLYTGAGWRYDPVYHGPVVYDFNAVSYFLFGDTDYTARLMPAIFGVLLVLMMLSLRREIGELEALYAAGFAALSPTLYYFSRFLRDDVYSACWSLLMFLGYLRYLRGRDVRWLYVVVVALALFFCTKVNCFIMGFTFCSSLMLYVAWYAWFREREVSPEGGDPVLRADLSATGLLARHQTVTKALCVFGWGVLSVFVYVVAFNAGATLSANVKAAYWSVVVGVGLLSFFFLDLLLYSWSEDEGREFNADSWYLRNRELFVIIVIFMSIFVLLYSNFFRFINLPQGTDASVGDLVGNGFVEGLRYWWGQQLNPRIPDVWYYYFPRLVIYELPLLLLVVLSLLAAMGDRLRLALIALLVGLMLTDFMGIDLLAKLGMGMGDGANIYELATYVGLLLLAIDFGFRELNRGRPERAIIIYWAALAFIIYAKANEKVPWLGVHVVLPLTLLGGVFAADIHRAVVRRSGKIVRGFALAFLVLGGAYLARSGLILNVHQEADPREIMVYVQSTTDVLDVLHEIQATAYRKGSYKKMRIVVEDEASWPFSWYLRHYKNVAYMPQITSLDASTALVLTKYPPDDRVRDILENGNYEGTRYQLRAWWQPQWLPSDSSFEKLGQYFSDLVQYAIYRRIFPPDIGSTDFMLYRKGVRPAAFSLEGTGLDTGPPLLVPSLPERIDPVEIQEYRTFGAGRLKQPRGIAVGPGGVVYVVDSGNNRILRYDLDGRELGSFGGSGSGDGKFNLPGGISIDSQGQVYVADTWNHRIQKFSSDGSFLAAWGSAKVFYGPRDVVVDGSDRVFVTDTGHQKIVCFTSEGEHLNEWGLKGAGHGEFNEPVGLAVTSSGVLLVADAGNRRIQMFDSKGAFLDSFPVAGWEYIYSEPYLAVDGQDRIWLTDQRNGRIQAYSLGGRFLGAVGTKQQLAGPIGIETDGDKNLVVADSTGNRVVVIPMEAQSVEAP